MKIALSILGVLVELDERPTVSGRVRFDLLGNAMFGVRIDKEHLKFEKSVGVSLFESPFD